MDKEKEQKIPYIICQECGKEVWDEKDACIGIMTQLCKKCAFERIEIIK